jgi:hypothetical protein
MDLTLKVGADIQKFNDELAKMNKGFTSLSSQITSVAKSVGLFMLAKEAFNLGLEMSKVAAEAEGVKSAFDKIQGSVPLLNSMRQATEGTVSDLKLMKLAVSAVNNGAPLEHLAEILNFIDRTADSTGKSFDELSDTIIKNIGKESTKGLNELGISLEAVKGNADKIGFLPALMGEIRKKSAELGEISSKTADSYDRQAASVENLQQSWGKFINSKGVSEFLDKVSSVFDMLSGRELTGTKEQVEQAAVAFKKLFDAARDSGNRDEMMKWGLEIAKLSSKYGLLKVEALDPVKQTITHTKTEVKKLVQEFDKLNSLARKKFLAPLELRQLGDITGTLVDPDKLTKQVQDSLKGLGKAVSAEVPLIKNQFIDLSETVQGSFVNIATSFAMAIGDMASGIGGIQNIAASVVGAFGAMAVQLGQTMIQFGIAGLALKAFFKKPGLAIAAGIALVALGKVLTNKASAIVGGGSARGGSVSGGDVSRGGNLIGNQSLILEGKFTIEGRDLVLAYDKNKTLDQKRK